ncbi:MAG TPA: helix-hairpin-helix domain-containing protein [Bryobacteraceae bacterium]|nr:helix-hairpin-helix domain-containing protein [Bryobacteraceae bacterium]
MHNVEIGRRLEEVADLLEAQKANPFRVQAYRRAAESVRRLSTPLAKIWHEQGDQGLRAVSGVGERLGTALRTLITTGRLPMLDRLRGETDPVALLESVSGIGPVLAERLHSELGIDSLEDLEAAAHDNRLRDLAGIGKKKLAGIVDSLATRLGRVRREGPTRDGDEPSVEELLEIDREYRQKATADQLPRITPRRFNPGGEAWLPILHTHRGERNYTALYSNTARAHELGRIRDWVVLYYDGGSDERQATVITSLRGSLTGKRIVRGRENECEQFYQTHQVAPGLRPE